MNIDIIWTLKVIPAAIIGLTIHEYCHALACYKLGDMTAKNEGRLSINPLKHIDPFGFLLIIIAGFGWAKPVHFNRDNLKHVHRDEIIISLAGPISNLVLGILFILLARILYLFGSINQSTLGLEIVNLLILCAVISFGLFAFNLIPIPPLDGSHIYTTYLKGINDNLLNILYKYGTWILLGIILLGNILNKEIIPISPIIMWITKTCISILGF